MANKLNKYEFTPEQRIEILESQVDILSNNFKELTKTVIDMTTLFRKYLESKQGE